jgi:chaperonin GroES
MAKKKNNKTKKAPAKKTAKPAVKKSVLGTPYGDRILVKPLSAEETGTVTSFGIIIPDTAKEKPEQGRVVAVGAGKRGEDGKNIPLSVKVGDRVMFSKYGYDEVKIGGTEYYLIAESSILMVLN